MTPKPLSGKRIMVCGKGGCGKSTVVTLMANVLRDKGYDVHIIDGDASNSGLYKMLGFDREPKPLVDYFGGITFTGERGKVACPVDDPTPLDRKKMDLKKIPDEYFLRKNNLIFFSVGKITKAYSGCHGPQSKVTRDFILKGDHVTLIDIEAGLEHFGRGIEVNIDAVITVVEPSTTSLQIAENVKRMAEDIKDNVERAKGVTDNLRLKHTWSILNKIDSRDIEYMMRERLRERGIKPIGSVCYDPKVFKWCLEGVPFRECGAKKDVEEIINKLEELD